MICISPRVYEIVMYALRHGDAIERAEALKELRLADAQHFVRQLDPKIPTLCRRQAD